MMNRIYMDNAATTALDPNVLAKMLPFFGEIYGNASSIHKEGREARKALENARRQVAAALHAEPSEVYFTSGGTESDNWALRGTAHALLTRGNHIITSCIEHPAVLNTCAELEKSGFLVTYLPVDKYGLVNPADVEKAITDKTTLISIMTANNEIGTIQPVSEIGRIAHERGVLFHTDAVQAIGSLPVSVSALHCDLLSLSAHKFHGPKGTGALYVRKGTPITPIIHGGSQERGMRASTENIPGIVGMGEAITLAVSNMEQNSLTTMSLRDRLTAALLQIPGAHLNGHPVQRLPGNVHFTFSGISGEALLLRLDLAGVSASSGSACTSGSPEVSHVLKKTGLSDEEASGSLRLSLNETNTMQECDTVAELIASVIRDLRHSP